MTEPAGGASKRILIGEITTVHGVRGEIVVRSYAAEPVRLADYNPLEDEAGRTLPALSVVRETPKGLVCRLQGLADRTAAEKLRGTKLYIPRNRLPPAEAGAYYHADLIGLSAVSPEGQPIGTIVAVENFGAGDLIEIRLEGQTATEYVPFADAFVPEVDVAAGRAVVLMPVAAPVDEKDVLGTDADNDDDEPDSTPR